MRRTAGARRPARSAWQWDWVKMPAARSAGRFMGYTALWATSIGGLLYGLHVLDPVAQRAVAAQPRRLNWVELPIWLRDAHNAAILDQIESNVAPWLQSNWFHPGAAAAIADALGASPWVHAVDHVSFRADGELSLRARFWNPVAMVVRKERAYLVGEAPDSDAIDPPLTRLPVELPAAQLDPRGPLPITGLQRAPVAVGQPWSDSELLSGLRLVRFLARQEAEQRLPFRALLRSVDVAQFDAKRQTLLITTASARSPIIWGRPPGDEQNLERHANGKLAALYTVYGRLGQFPDTGPIDIRPLDRIEHGGAVRP